MFEKIIEMIKANPGYFTIGVILLILGILIDIYYPKFRGFMGEFWLKLELKKLPKNKYKLLNDIMIEDEKGTHQIDHIVISKYGIFVIEMKNYYGLIIGNQYKEKWYQYLGKNKYTFHNPMYQNYGHIKALSNVLKLNEELFIPITCFSNQVKLKVTSNKPVVQVDTINKNILKYTKEIITCNLNELSLKIENMNILDKTKRKGHIKNICNLKR